MAVLTSLYMKQGKYDEAEELLGETIEIRQRVLGHHPVTLASMNSLAVVYEHQGRYDESRFYRDDPAEVAREFEQAGARWIHVVDLDAARGQGHNREAIAEIRRATGCRVEVGGGIRTQADLAELLEIGVERLILGTILAREPEVVAGWIDLHADRLVAGVDADRGQVRVSGWQEGAGLVDLDFVRTLSQKGVQRLIYTSISQDGTLKGPDVERTGEVADAFAAPTILSGGIGSDQHLELVFRGRSQFIAGVITGTAVYEGRVDLESAIRRYQSGDEKW